MTVSVTVYGFGSAFRSGVTANDIDLLIIHANVTPTSCQFAIECKHRLSEHFHRVHVTMLSESEEASFGFIWAARAVRIGIVRKSAQVKDFAALFKEIRGVSRQKFNRHYSLNYGDSLLNTPNS